MSKNLDVEIVGVEAMQKKFAEIGVKTGRKLLRRSIGAITKPMLKEIRAKTPRDEGDLRRSMKQKARAGKGSSGTIAAVDVGQVGRVSDKDRQAGVASEFGRKSQAADPFFHPTAERHAPRIVEGVKKDLLRELLRARVTK